MVDLKKLEKEVKILGLNSYEARLWIALLSKGVATAGELSDLADVPRSRTYDVLRSLEKKGLVVQKIGKPIKYAALPPKEALENYKRHIKEASEEKINIINKMEESEIFEALLEIFNREKKERTSKEHISYIKGIGNIFTYLSILANNANEELIIFTTPQEIESRLHQYKKILNNLEGKNIKVKVVVNGNIESTNFNGVLGGIEVLHMPRKESIRGVIKDGEEVMLILNNYNEVHPSQEIAVHMNSPFVAGFMKRLAGDQ